MRRSEQQTPCGDAPVADERTAPITEIAMNQSGDPAVGRERLRRIHTRYDTRELVVLSYCNLDLVWDGFQLLQ